MSKKWTGTEDDAISERGSNVDSMYITYWWTSRRDLI